MENRLLSDEQLMNFDGDFVDRFKWRRVRDCISRDFPSGDFSVLDVGGGNGLFADKILAEYPMSRVTVLDLSQMLLAKNRPHPRKNVVLGSALELKAIQDRWDLICINWLLHHLVAESYASSIANILSVLGQARELITPRGRLSVYENMFDGILIDRAPGRIIYELTATRWLSAFTRLAGANTGGVGVCFLSEQQWRRIFQKLSLRLNSFHRHDAFERTVTRNIVQGIALHLRPMGAAHFWLQCSSAPAD